MAKPNPLLWPRQKESHCPWLSLVEALCSSSVCGGVCVCCESDDLFGFAKRVGAFAAEPNKPTGSAATI